MEKEERVEGPAVRAAIRELKESKGEEVKLARTRKELAEFLLSFDAPAYGSQDSPVRLMAQYFAKFEKGQGTERTMRAKLEACFSKQATATKAAGK